MTARRQPKLRLAPTPAALKREAERERRRRRIAHRTRKQAA